MTYTIDGDAFSTLEGFFDEISRVLIPGAQWGHNLDAFNDILRGGFGTPEEGFEIIWNNHEVSRERLGYAYTVHWLEQALLRCHPTNRDNVAARVAAARSKSGPTVFDWLVEIIQDHGTGGEQEQDCVLLTLQ